MMWNMLCFEMWWCEMVVRGRLRCNAMSEVEHVVCSNAECCAMVVGCGMVWCGMV